MIFIIYVKASFSTATRRNNVFGIVQNYMNQPAVANDMFVAPHYDVVDNWGYKGWPNALLVEVRCRTEATRDDLWTQVIDGMTGPAAPSKGYAEKWDQMLDAADPDADTNRYNQTSQSWP